MAAPTYSELLDDFLTCLQAIGQDGQHTALSGRVYTKADLKEVRETIDWLETKVIQQSSSTSTSSILDRSFTGVPCRGA